MSELKVTVDGVTTVIAADQRPTQIFAERKEVVVCRINGELRDLWTDLSNGDVVESVNLSRGKAGYRTTDYRWFLL